MSLGIVTRDGCLRTAWVAEQILERAPHTWHDQYFMLLVVCFLVIEFGWLRNCSLLGFGFIKGILEGQAAVRPLRDILNSLVAPFFASYLPSYPRKLVLELWIQLLTHALIAQMYV